MQRQPVSLHQDTVPIPLVHQDAPAHHASSVHQDTPGEAAESAPPASTPPAFALSPVFVDSSGRRQRRVRRLGRLLVIPAAAYVALLVSTLLGGPTVQSPLLPLPAPPAAPSQAPGGPAVIGARPPASGSPNGGQGRTGSAVTSGPGTAKGANPTPGVTPPASTPSASVAASASASTAPTHGKSTHSASPPGTSHRANPSKKA